MFSLCPHVTFYKTLTSLFSTVFIKGHIRFLQLLKWPCNTSFFHPCGALTVSQGSMLDVLDWDSLETHKANSRLSLLGKILHCRVALDTDSYLKRSYTRTHTVNSVKLERYSARTAVYQNSYFPGQFHSGILPQTAKSVTK